MKTPINKTTLKHHFTYSWWKYLCVFAAVIVIVWMPFDTIFRPRIPEEKKISIYIYGYADTEKLNARMEEVRVNELPDMEEMSSLMLSVDETYGPMQLTTYIAAGEGDLYLLPREEFLSLASGGVFQALEDDAELMAVFDEAGVDLRRGWRSNSETGETHLYGIPVNFLPGLSRYCYVENGFLSVFVRNGNEENVRTFLLALVREMINEPEPVPEEEASSGT